MRDFSLKCSSPSDAYDEVVVPTLQRMINLKKLSLSLVIACERRFVDGNHLKAHILRHMPRLEDFRFNIRSIMPLDFDPAHLPTDEDIRCTFEHLTKHSIISYVDYFPNDGEGHCHFYTSPYSLIDYEYVSNSLPEGLFAHVRNVELYDERPFEHSFFLRLAQAFPSMKTLSIINLAAQTEKQGQQSCDEHGDVPLIRYPSLQGINFLDVHDDYVEQFFFHTRTFFSDDIHVTIDASQLERVTHNYMRDETRINYSKVKSFDFWNE